MPSLTPGLGRPLLGGREVRPLERVQVRVTEARDARRQDLVGALAGEVTALGEHRLAVDRVVDRLGERRALRSLEERAVMVERQVGDAELRLDPELALVDAVLLGGLGVRRGRNAAGGVVGRALLRAQVRGVERVADRCS